MKQLIIISDMEGASGIFDEHLCELFTGEDEWRKYGREKMTSDVLAVCEAANEYGIDEILYYDGHFAGCKEYNTQLEKLPSNVKVFDIADRCFFWRRIRGQAAQNPFGIITVGQHSRSAEEDAYFPHTIQSPPIKSYWVNGKHIAEIGTATLNFRGTKYIANIGCAASEKESKEITKTVHHISVKDKKINWQPSPSETFPIIKEGVLKALNDYDNLETIKLDPPYNFKLELCDTYSFEIPKDFPWKGRFSEKKATWQAPDFEIGNEIFNYVRDLIKE